MQIIFILFGAWLGVFIVNALVALPVAALVWWAFHLLGHPVPFLVTWIFATVGVYIFGGRRAD